ncbi:MAG TPA: asparagine synthase (glutamine-hydrolyzing) [Terriglobales bacterium]
MIASSIGYCEAKMCGIVAIAAYNANVPKDVLERATLSLAHRGPDDSGTVIVGDLTPEPVEIGLGSRRLAIQDLSPLGHQPMRDPETGNWIVFNGEIYNFREIRDSLRHDDVRFQGHSDTEVLLKAYARWGTACLEQLRGMFAFALWDVQRRRLFAARDPMGIKPLYYCQSSNYLLIASEVRTLLGTGMVPHRLDAAGLVNYLEFGSACDPITLIEGVSNLRPGHALTWDRGRAREELYWDIPTSAGTNRPLATNRERMVEEVQRAVDESVRMQTVSDVPVGVFLSGGIDSSAIAGILSRSGVHVDTFSIVFRESDYSEAQYSRQIAREFATRHHEIMVSQFDALEAIPHAVKAMDQPSIDGLNTYLISRQTRAAGVKVALSGLGGDELFGGYSSFSTVPRMERFSRLWSHVPRMIRKAAAGTFSALVPSSDQNRKLSDLVRQEYGFIHSCFLSRGLFTDQLRNRLRAHVDSQTETRASLAQKRALEHARGLDPVNRVSYLEMRGYMLNTLLRDADVMSMAHGLELRVPLIDHKLTELAMRLPGDWKLSADTPKSVLVNALAGAIPKEVVSRTKRGFTLPFEHWLKDELRPEVEKMLHSTADGPLATMLHASAVQDVWQDFLRGQTAWSRPWALYVLENWCRMYGISAK